MENDEYWSLFRWLLVAVLGLCGKEALAIGLGVVLLLAMANMQKEVRQY